MAPRERSGTFLEKLVPRILGEESRCRSVESLGGHVPYDVVLDEISRQGS